MVSFKSRKFQKLSTIFRDDDDCFLVIQLEVRMQVVLSRTFRLFYDPFPACCAFGQVALVACFLAAQRRRCLTFQFGNLPIYRRGISLLPLFDMLFTASLFALAVVCSVGVPSPRSAVVSRPEDRPWYSLQAGVSRLPGLPVALWVPRCVEASGCLVCDNFGDLHYSVPRPSTYVCAFVNDSCSAHRISRALAKFPLMDPRNLTCLTVASPGHPLELWVGVGFASTIPFLLAAAVYLVWRFYRKKGKFYFDFTCLLILLLRHSGVFKTI